MLVRRAAPHLFLSALIAIVLASVAVRPRAPEGPRALPSAERPYDAAERRARIEWTSIEARVGTHSLAAAHAADALVRALLDNGRGWTDEALSLGRRVVKEKEALGAAGPDLARSLVGLGAVLADSGDYSGALMALQRADRLVGAASSRESSETAVDVFDHLAVVLALAGRYDEGLSTIARSLALKSRGDVAPASLAQTLEIEALAAQGAGLYSRSAAAIRRAIALRQRGGTSDDPARVSTLNLLAQQLWFEGRFTESRSASEEAERLGERTLRETHPRLAETIRYLAATDADLGDVDRSRRLRERALALATTEFGQNHVKTGAYLNSAARGDLSVGDYVSARRRFAAAVVAVETHYGRWHDYVATSRLNLALVHAQLGDYEKAEEEHARAIEIWERILGRDHPYVAVALSELATVYQRQNRPSAARPLLERALAIRERQLGRNHPQTAQTLVDLAAALMQLDEHARAQTLAERALAIWRQRDVPNAPDYAKVLALDASIQHQAGRDKEAEQLYRQALAILERAFGNASPEYADVEAGLSRTLASLGNHSAALRSSLHAETVGRDHLRLLLRALPERQAVEYAAARPRGLDVLLSLAVATAEAVRPALGALVQTRALVLDSIADRQRTLRQADTRERAAWRSAQQRLANLLVRGPGPMTTAQFNDVVDRARRERDAAEEQMAISDVAFRAERLRGQLDLDAVLAALPPDAALVSFTRYREEQPGGATEPVRPQTSYAASILQRNQAPVALRIGSSEVVDAQVERWRTALISTLDTPPGEQVAFNDPGDALRRTVWDPIARHVRNARMLFIVPDGALALIPFAALPSASGGYLIEEGRVIHYLSAERDLVSRRDLPLSTRGLLAIGGVSFGDYRSNVQTVANTAVRGGASPGTEVLCGLQTRSFAALPGTVREVRDISALWTQADGTHSDAVRVLTGAAATETAFKQQASAFRTLHLATHGFFIASGCPVATRPALRGFGGLAPVASGPADNPLQLSGLAMSGANNPKADNSDDDGILTAEEVTALDLSGVEWAVLSACDTGLGTSRADEGVFGLRRAFQAAGARTVIMSLWSVDDAATRTWMRALYSARLLRHRSTSDAVHDADLSVLRDRRAAGLSTHPVYWASFVAVGDWH